MNPVVPDLLPIDFNLGNFLDFVSLDYRCPATSKERKRLEISSSLIAIGYRVGWSINDWERAERGSDWPGYQYPYSDDEVRARS